MGFGWSPRLGPTSPLGVRSMLIHHPLSLEPGAELTNRRKCLILKSLNPEKLDGPFSPSKTLGLGSLGLWTPAQRLRAGTEMLVYGGLLGLVHWRILLLPRDKLGLEKTEWKPEAE